MRTGRLKVRMEVSSDGKQASVSEFGEESLLLTDASVALNTSFAQASTFTSCMCGVEGLSRAPVGFLQRPRRDFLFRLEQSADECMLRLSHLWIARCRE